MFKNTGNVTFIFEESGEKVVKFREGETVLETAMRNKLPLDSSCTEGTCGSCRVNLVISPPELEPAGEVELETKAERGFAPDERLSCQMIACDGLKVRVPSYD